MIAILGLLLMGAGGILILWGLTDKLWPIEPLPKAQEVTPSKESSS